MEKLFIPQNCLIEGSISNVSNDGDIQLENGVAPSRITSHDGSIRITRMGEGTICETFMAPNGEIDIQGDSLKIDNLVAKSLTAQFVEFDGQTLQATSGTTFINGKKITVSQLSGEHVEIEGETVHIGMLRASGSVKITADHIHIQELEGTEVTVAGKFESNKVSASDGFYVTSGHVAIKNLDSPSFSSDEGVGGIVMVATCEKVQTQGVRGFLRPAELGLFSQGATTMDLMEIIGGAGTKASTPVMPAPAEPEPTQADTPLPESEVPQEAVDEIIDSTPPEPTFEPEEVVQPEPEIETSELIEIDSMDMDEEPEISEEAPSEPMMMEQPVMVEQPVMMEQTEMEELEPPQESPVVDLQELSAQTTVSLDGEDLEDDGEMATIQLEPNLLAQAIQANSDVATEQNDDLLEANALEVEAEVEEIAMPEASDDDVLASDDRLDDSGELPEIAGFDDYQNTGELNDLSDALDEAMEDPDLVMQELDMPAQDEDLWEEPSDLGEEVSAPELEEDIEVEGLEDDDIEVEELSEDDFYSVDDDDFEDISVEESKSPEETLRDTLTTTLNSIRDFFPDENYPKFIYQIQNYVNESRFSILAKPRNRDAVLSSFSKLNHPEISKMADTFYGTLAEYFEGQE